MSKTTSAFISVIGRPNVGKSSLVNRAVGMKVAIVSDKPQTTRTRIMGVLTKNENQYVFVDTPGFHRPKNRLGENMVKAVGVGMSDVDVALLVVDAAPKFTFDSDSLPLAELELIEELKKRKLPAILILNKIDLLEDKEVLLTMIMAYTKAYDFAAVIPLSAKTGDGIDILIDEVSKFSKPSVHYFEEDDFTDQPERIIVAEMIREKLLRLLTREVPHGIAVDIEKFRESTTASDEPILDVEATIYCEKDSHKGIVIGKGGAMLKKVGTLARQDMENFFSCRVNLKLWVKVKEDWRNKVGIIRSLGLDE